MCVCVFVCVLYLHDQLMGTGHQGEAVGVVEGFGDVLSKGVAGTSGRNTPPAAIVWVRPQQVTHWALRERERATVISQCRTSYFFFFVKHMLTFL